jgi:hypothetical protein
MTILFFATFVIESTLKVVGRKSPSRLRERSKVLGSHCFHLNRHLTCPTFIIFVLFSTHTCTTM